MPRTRKPVTVSNRVIVAGVGYTGSRVIEALGAERAIGLTRRPADERESRQLDLDKGIFPQTKPDDSFSIVYTIPPARDSETDRRLARFLEWLDDEPERFVYISTSGVYGDTAGAVVDETATPAPTSSRSRRRLAAEQALQHYAERSGCRLVILRAPGIYGPGRLGLERIRRMQPVIGEHDANPGNRIHVDDLVQCCIAALDADTKPGIYNVSDGDHRSSTWFTQAVADASALPRVPEVTRAEAERSFSTSRMSFLKESRRLDNRKMLETLGVELLYPNPEDGIRASL